MLRHPSLRNHVGGYTMLGGQPILILREGTQRESGKSAQKRNIAAARAIADAVRSTLGPKGMDKMLVDTMGDVVITNDGVTILKEIDVAHPAAKMVVEVAKTQDEECGDGTTSAVIIAGQLLQEADELIDMGVHPTIITRGFRMASDQALKILRDIAIPVEIDDIQQLTNIAATTMTGKALGGARDHLADIAVTAVRKVTTKSHDRREADIDNVKIVKKHGGSIGDTRIHEGIVMDKEPVHPDMPRTIRDARIALLSSALEAKKTEVSADIRITNPAQLQMFLDEEERMMKAKVDRVLASGATAVICQKGIDDTIQYFLAKAGVLALKSVSEKDMKMIAKATGATIVSVLDELSENHLGTAGRVHTTKIGSDEMTFISECPRALAVSILIRGGTEHVVDEVERAMHDALSVVSLAIEDGFAVTGGGAPEIELALRLREYASSVGGREQLAIDGFARAMEIIPRTLAENAGLDQVDILVRMRSAHGGKNANIHTGLNAYTGSIVDMRAERVMEPLRVKVQGITSATEVATMILRIDDVIASRDAGGPSGGMGGGPGMGGMGGMDY